MSFLNPLLLFGATAVGVPILIHLLNRRKFQKVVWAAMRFIKTSIQQNQRRMQIEDLILLALRCLMLLLLAFALARPAMRNSASDLFGQTKVTAVVILDNSASMGISDGVKTRFDKARIAAEQTVDAMPSGSATAVFLASDVAQTPIPEPTHDLNLARKTLREAPLSDRSTDLFPALEKALKTLEGRMAIRKEIYLVTDGQAAGWRQLGDIQKLLAKAKKDSGDNKVTTHVIFVGDAEERNLGVSGLTLASGLTAMNRPLRFEARVTNYGKQEAKDVRVSLNVNSDPASDEVNIPSIPPGATRSVSLFAKLRSEGHHAVHVRIPEDRYHADDRRTLAVRAIRETKVLLVDGNPGSEPRDDETFFLGHALVPVPPADAENYFVKTTTIGVPELEGTRLDDYDAVVLANVAEFPVATVGAIEAYLRRGGGLMVFPGGKVNVAFYNDQLLKRSNLLPAALGQPRGDAAAEDKFVSLQAQGYDHPIVSIWNDATAGTLSSARFFRSFELLPQQVESGQGGKPESGKSRSPTLPLSHSPTNAAPDAGAPKVVLRYADGTPAVMERPWGLGRVVLFSSTATTTWNDLPVRPAFLPLLQRALGSIVQRQDEGLNLRVGQGFTRRMSTEALGKDAVIASPAQQGGARELKKVELVAGVAQLQYDATDKSGVYEVTVGEPPQTIRFATQADPGESSLDELPAEDVKSLGEAATFFRWSPTMSIRELVEKQRVGTEFWLPLAILGLLLAVLETWLAQWFSRAK